MDGSGDKKRRGRPKGSNASTVCGPTEIDLIAVAQLYVQHGLANETDNARKKNLWNVLNSQYITDKKIHFTKKEERESFYKRVSSKFNYKK